jgi:hypothetical protein
MREYAWVFTAYWINQVIAVISIVINTILAITLLFLIGKVSETKRPMPVGDVVTEEKRMGGGFPSRPSY